MSKTWAVCKCFFEKNLYLKSLGRHVEFRDENQFISDYNEELSSVLDISKVIDEITTEISRRRDRMVNSQNIRNNVANEYIPIHPELFDKSENVLNRTKLSPTLLFDDVFTSPVLEKDVCIKLIEELDNFKLTGLPFSQPNSMNRHGVLLGELGYDHLVDQLRKLVEPEARRLFPDLVGDCGLDSVRAFTVDYDKEEVNRPDIELATHWDNSEVTLNISLRSDHEDGELYFMSGPSVWPVQHYPGHGILHPGRVLHGAMPVTEGRRTNLILWFRCSSVRNEKCPMCGLSPNLQPTEWGQGDGFTLD